MRTVSFSSTELARLPSAVAIGVFDGVHLGHRAVLRRMVGIARERSLAAVAVTFDRNPKMAKGTIPFSKPLASRRAVEVSMADLGVDFLCVIDFSEEMSKLAGVEFIARLGRFCQVAALVAGSDFRCGRPGVSLGAAGIGEAFRRLGIDGSVVVEPPVLDRSGEVVSSSLVRSMLQKGDLAGSARLLGRPYSLDLGSVPQTRSGKDVLIEAGSVAELLPREGLYEASAVAEDGVRYDIALAVNGSCLAFQLPEPVQVDSIIFKG